MKVWILSIVGVVIVAVGAFMIVKKVSPVSWGLGGDYNTSSGLALKGYDPVAYFQDAEATSGSSEFTHEWGDATWQFANADNRALFVENPDSFAPQFGGYCSFAVSKGFTADISPDAWHVRDGKLYVFADKDVQADWVAGIGDGTLGASAANWEKR